jgi:hypothetical protein
VDAAGPLSTSCPTLGAMPVAPVPEAPEVDVATALRLEVWWLRREQQRRVFPPRLHLGTPGDPHSLASGGLSALTGAPWPPPRWLDAGARADVCDRLVSAWGHHHESAAYCWYTRPGLPDLHDEDHAWLAAVRWAFAAHDLPLLGFWVVTRYGWRDPVSGEERRWKRLRVKR